ncbi:MAG: hypothetical protein GDA67_10255 [Nitrospira sp. CR1.3]|nr:hypothetical protein [Nitrospira sp. CR1.3]
MRTIRQLSITGYILPAIALFSLLFSVAEAKAALVTYSFTGGVSQVNGALLPTVNLMSPVSGMFQFDNSPAVGGNYPGVVSNMTLNIGGYTSTYAPGANAVTIFKGIDLGGGSIGDRWRLVTAATGSAINGYSPFRFDLHLDREGSLFANTNMQNPPGLGSLTGSRWRLIFENAEGNLVRIQGSLSSLTAVPLPAAVLLFGAGLISLVGLGAGGLRNLRGTQS